MREIKFRAWDNKKGKWYKNNECCLTISEYGALLEITPDGAGWDVRNEYEVCQFTGLKDKNGKEIYQSDLIQHIADGNAPHPILEVIWWDEKCAWAVKDEVGGYAMLWPEKDIKVIGNIFENPELVNENPNLLQKDEPRKPDIKT